MAASIITIYDRQGNILTDIEAQVDREWLLNEYGEATFTLAKNDPKCREEYLRFGNRIVIESNADDESGVDLPAWGGVIDTPREWGDHDITIHAYSAEYLFTFRRGPVSLTHESSFGGVLLKMIDLANMPEDLGIRAGEVYQGDAAVSRKLELTEMYDALIGLVEDSGMDWSIEPAFDGAGRLYFAANWYEQRGVDSNFALEEGLNIQASSNALVEQENIVNDVLAYSSSMTGWNANKTRTARDEDSIALYGLRSAALSVSTNDGDLTTVASAAEAELKKKKQAARTYDLTVMTDRAGAVDAVGQIRVGNSYPLNLLTAGWNSAGELGTETRVRVVGMRWTDADQVLALNCEEVIA